MREDTSPGDADANLTRRSLLTAAAGAGVANTAGCAGISTPADVADAATLPGNVAYVRGPGQLDAESSVFLGIPERSRNAVGGRCACGAVRSAPDLPAAGRTRTDSE